MRVVTLLHTYTPTAHKLINLIIIWSVNLIQFTTLENLMMIYYHFQRLVILTSHFDALQKESVFQFNIYVMVHLIAVMDTMKVQFNYYSIDFFLIEIFFLSQTCGFVRQVSKRFNLIISNVTTHPVTSLWGFHRDDVKILLCTLLAVRNWKTRFPPKQSSQVKSTWFNRSLFQLRSCHN